MTRPATRLDQQHDHDCLTGRGADPDLCGCDLETPVARRPAPPRDRPATPPQRQRMQSLFRAAGITDRTERLARTGELIGRRVTSCSELTERQNQLVCAQLESQIARATRG